MHVVHNISKNQQEKTLKDFIPLAVTFFIGLVLLSVYQNIALYVAGVLDSVINKSFFILLVHQLGFASVCALFTAFLFNFLEARKPKLGYHTAKGMFMVLLIAEGVLMTYYVQNYETLGANLFGLVKSAGIRFSFFQALGVSTITLCICHYTSRYVSSFYTIISRMYPITLILFSMFLATLYSEKKQVNESKTQHLLERIAKNVFQSDVYEDDEEFPLVTSYDQPTELHKYLELTERLPDIKIIIVNGLGSDFMGNQKPYGLFMPHLDQLKNESLYWSNFLSNTGESHAALPTVIGSLPFGQNGFTNLENFNYRNTLFSILKHNGYSTTFGFGGNTGLYAIDRFLKEEKVTTILDKTAFGSAYEQQEEDAAGISLGYPDKALFKRYNAENLSANTPRLDVLCTLSTGEPYLIPQTDNYVQKVKKQMEDSGLPEKTKRIIAKNEKLFASFIYADEALGEFMVSEKKKKGYGNTIYIITGSHYTSGLPQENPLARYRVPLLIHSPLLKTNKEITIMASHADITPSLLSVLQRTYNLKIPDEVAWMGGDLFRGKNIVSKKKIPLLRGSHNIRDYIRGDYFLSDGDVFVLDKNLKLQEAVNEKEINTIKKDFRFFKSVNKYVTENNKIIPERISLVANTKKEFNKEEMIWIQSVFNGKDFDKAYKTAKNLAINKEWERALLLCDYILSEIPRHADAEILMGRLYAWQEQYEMSITVLKKVIYKYPKYDDGYCAIMDTYFWSGQNGKVYEIEKLVRSHKVKSMMLSEKIQRSIQLVQQEKLKETSQKIKNATVQILESMQQ
ncbi:sulfatase-like hydrolase/transferase [Maribacter sp. 2304DJ31-5]|uniref:sulfatase-like hydrolase/transferase n=1 Tax=Maribacter sp. 2304DJ31-5 TaxID=3386273 RepID=UPI0039BD323C